jgi:type I site-specific restriction endonuclease
MRISPAPKARGVLVARELPFCFYTNGLEIFFWKLGEAPPQQVHGFPTRQDLERLLFIRKHKKPLSDELINTAIAGRDFQLQAIRSVMLQSPMTFNKTLPDWL